MAVRRKNPQILVLDAALEDEIDGVDTLVYGSAEDGAVVDEVGDPVCPRCGELLAWHEEACTAPVEIKAPEPAANKPKEPDTAAEDVPEWAPSPFTYAIGQPVQPAPASRVGRIIWRGQVKERHPRTGLLHRVNVYRLDNGFWDCYFEGELHAISEPDASESPA